MNGLALGHARLAIIDLGGTGAQPMVDESSGVILVYNGEIYNYLELRSELAQRGHCFASMSDTEVLLRAYLEWGLAAFQRFVGMWAVALYDPRVDELVLSRDRFGIKPLFFYIDAKRLVFGSTIMSVMAASCVPRRWNASTIHDFLAHRSVDESQQTFFADVLHFPPGTHAVLKIAETGVALRFEPYWEAANFLDLAADKGSSFAAAAAKFRALLLDSIRLHTRSDVEVSSCLSGGLDSSTVVSALATMPEGAGIRKVFSAVFPGCDYDEDQYSDTVAERFDLERFRVMPNTQTFLDDIERVVEAQEEPFGSTGVYVQWKVFEAIHKENIKVALDGQGADEYLGGYLSFLVPYAFDCLARGGIGGAWRAWVRFRETNRIHHHLSHYIPSLITRLLGISINDRLSPLRRYLSRDLVITRHAEALLETPDSPLPAGIGLKRTLLGYLTRYSLPGLLRYEDRNSMYFSVESRVPFLDHRLVEFVLSLPADYVIDGHTTKRLLREAVRGIVPEVVITRKDKLGFANPESDWVIALMQSGAIHDFVSAAEASDFIDVTMTRRLLACKPLDAHDHNFLWRLYSLLAWRQWAFR
jgi:asparagine synthase (glutamine-hydrolysing)